jgi:hypothetical protein
MFIGFGNKKEWQYVEETYPVFVQKVPLLFRTAKKLFDREIRGDAPVVDKVVFHLGFLCFEDFREILLLCANGYGIGGSRILRSLFEKAVTADYLSTHPDEAENFLDYSWVHIRKTINHQRNVYKRDLLPAEEIEEINREYEKVKDKFQEPSCKKCGTTKPQMSWTKLDVGSMARAANSPLQSLYYFCYFLPTLQSHTTMPAIFERLVEGDEGHVYLSIEPQREDAKNALERSHLIMLNVLNRQNEHFKLGIDEELWERAKDLEESWPDQNKENLVDESK